MDIASIVEDTRTRLVKFQGRYPEVVETAAALKGSTKLSYSWLTKFAQGRVPNPTVDNLVALAAALAKLEEVSPTSTTEDPAPPPRRTTAAKGETAETAATATALTGQTINTY